jgi:hypothetical protein
MNNTLKSDVKETCYEVVFTGTCNRERKVRRHTFGIAGHTFESNGQHNHAIHNIVRDHLRMNGAVKGKYALQSYEGTVSEYEREEEGETIIMRNVMRDLFDFSTHTIATGEVTK